MNSFIATDKNSGFFFALDVDGYPTLSPMLDDAELFTSSIEIDQFVQALEHIEHRSSNAEVFTVDAADLGT